MSTFNAPPPEGPAPLQPPSGLRIKLTKLTTTPSRSSLYAIVIGVIIAVIAVILILGLYVLKSPSSPSINLPLALTVSNATANSSLLFFKVMNENNDSVHLAALSAIFKGSTYSNFQCASDYITGHNYTICNVKTSNLLPNSSVELSLKYNLINSSMYNSLNESLQIKSLSNISGYVYTKFNETGLPSGSIWRVGFNGIYINTNRTSVWFYNSMNIYSFNVSAVTVSGCIFTPSPKNGRIAAAITEIVRFNSSCSASFSESGLPAGMSWSVTYDGITKSTSAPSNIVFTTRAGVFNYSVNSLTTASGSCTTMYSPSPAAGRLVAGFALSISFSSSTSCSNSTHVNTTFSSSGLSTGISWSVTYDGITKSASAPSNIVFTTSTGTFAYSVPTISNSSSNCTTMYSPSPANGSTTAGTRVNIIFSGSTSCSSSHLINTTFSESALPSGASWAVTFAGTTKTKNTPSSIIFSTSRGNFSFSVQNVVIKNASSSCDSTYHPNPASGIETAGSNVSVTFSSITTSCNTAFMEQNLPLSGVSSVTSPQNILYIIPITINNTQSSPTASPFQQLINVSSSSNFWNEINYSGQNVEFFYANGTIISSWLESVLPSFVWWVKIGSIAPKSTLTIYMGLANVNVSLFNNVNVGLAPYLPSNYGFGTYGQYDDGANVFNFYDNFAGTALSSKWVNNTVNSGGKLTINNGMSFARGTVGNAQAFLYSKTNFSTGVYETYGTIPAGGSSLLKYIYAAFGASNRSATNYGAAVGDFKSVYGLRTGTSLAGHVQIPGLYGGDYIWQLFVPAASPAFINASQDYGTMITSNSYVPNFPLPITFFDQNNTGINVGPFNWVRVRAYPPNNVMPSVSFGTWLIKQWNVTYDGINSASTQNAMVFSTSAGTFSFSVPNEFSYSPVCITTYAPYPSSGSQSSGSSKTITFTPSTLCTTTFFESNLAGSPMDIPWNITYDGVDNQSSLFPGGCVEICRMPSYSTSINFYTPPGSYAYSASVAPSTPNEIGIYKPINKNISNPGQPLGIAFDSLNKEIFVADYADNKTSIINTSTNTVINNITGFAHPYILVFDPANKLLYISDYGANKITVVNTTSDAVLKNISTPSSNSVFSMTFDQADNEIWAADEANIVVINATTNQNIKNMSLPYFPSSTLGITYDPSNGYVYASIWSAGVVAQINTNTYKIIENISVQSGPQGLAYDPSNKELYVANFLANTTSVINTTTNTNIKNIAINGSPTPIAYGGNAIYVLSYNSAYGSIISDKTNSVISTFYDGYNPSINYADSVNGFMAEDTLNGVMYLTDSINNVTRRLNKIYVPSPMSGTLTAGSTMTITYS